MADPKPGDVQIIPPDRSLQQKVGTLSLEGILSPQVVAVAQQTIVRASDALLEDSVADAGKLERAAADIDAGPDRGGKALREITDAAFSLKSKSALGGYDFIAVLAKSLHQYCEECDGANITAANASIIKWHIQSLKRLLDMKIKGSGGPVGEAILAELKKLGVKIEPAVSRE